MTAFDPHAAGTHPETPGDADHGHAHEHPPHLAHHFDTPEQQYDSAKIGMWVFLATEILMFGGLFCAYAVYRFNNPDVFRYSEHHLNTWLGATNTVVLLASSLTMALAVRAAQLGQKTYLKLMLGFTLLGAVGFMCIKAVEYGEKFSHGLFPGMYSVYDKQQNPEGFADYFSGAHGDDDHGDGSGDHPAEANAAHGEGTAIPDNHGEPHAANDGDHQGEDPVVNATPADQQSPTNDQPAGEGRGTPAEAVADTTVAASNQRSIYGPGYVDPNAGSSDAALHVGRFNSADGLAASHGEGHAAVEYTDLSAKDQSNVPAFFNIYYMMTGLHGVHVLVGMGLIGWVLLRANEFGPGYFTPVDLVGLYWHLVDLIWIFLFPLLYLIH